MNENDNQNENQKPTEKKITLQEILNGEFLTREWFRKQYKLFILIGALVFLYIFFGYQARLQQHRITILQKELQDKHFEQLSIESELTERTRQSNLENELHERGSQLKENKKPLIRIR